MARTNDLTADEWAFWSQWVTAQQMVNRSIDRRLQRDAGISKAEFSVLMTLVRASPHAMPVSLLLTSLEWEKSRLSHQLTRMELRGLIAKDPSASGRRSVVALTSEGDEAIRHAIAVHSQSVRELFLRTVSPSQAMAIRQWCASIIESTSQEAP